MTSRTVAYLVTEAAKLSDKASSLQLDMVESIQASKSAIEFRKELYAAAKVKSERAYAAIRQLFNRAIKSLAADGVRTDADKENRGKSSKKAAPKAVPEKVTGMTDALAIARVGQLATSFLTADDQVIMARLLAALDHQRKLATKSKK